MKRLLAVLALLIGMAIAAMPFAQAQAAPIKCQGSATPQKVNGQWVCVNPGGGTPSGAIRSKH